MVLLEAADSRRGGHGYRVSPVSGSSNLDLGHHLLRAAQPPQLSTPIREGDPEVHAVHVGDQSGVRGAAYPVDPRVVRWTGARHADPVGSGSVIVMLVVPLILEPTRRCLVVVRKASQHCMTPSLPSSGEATCTSSRRRWSAPSGFIPSRERFAEKFDGVT